METKTLKQYGLLKGTGKSQQIGVPYKTEKGYFIRWVVKPNKGQWEFIEDYIENNDPPKKKPVKKAKK